MSDEAAVGALLDRLEKAIHDKDAEAVIACLSDDVVSFDLPPPLVITAETARDPASWQEWFDTWDGPITSTARDRVIRLGGDVGFAHSLVRMSGRKTDSGEVTLWFRTTAGVVKQGDWTIAHMHNSVPFAMDGSGKALLDLKP